MESQLNIDIIYLTTMRSLVLRGVQIFQLVAELNVDIQVPTYRNAGGTGIFRSNTMILDWAFKLR
jgi:hypothetical protein